MTAAEDGPIPDYPELVELREQRDEALAERDDVLLELDRLRETTGELVEDRPIAARLAAAALEVGSVGKTSEVAHGRTRFRFRGIDAVVNATAGPLHRHGIVVVPHLETIAYDTVRTSGGSEQTRCRVTVTYTFTCGDPTYGRASSLSVLVPGEAQDSGDKSTTKAMSVAFRTALLQALTLPTDEPDPDEHVVENVEPDEDPVARRTALELALSEAPDGFLEWWGEDKRAAWTAHGMTNDAYATHALDLLDQRVASWRETAPQLVEEDAS